MTAGNPLNDLYPVADRPSGAETELPARKPGTTCEGAPFPASVVRAVWDKGHLIPGRDPDEWRCDICGSTIRFLDHGNTKSRFGWEIDHVLPVSKGGKDDGANLRPLQWEINRLKGDAYPW